ncbi:MAG: cbb3-type cytochrome oxidase assembly protein [Pirellulaceae bacterium]|nr:cbb3-type cytochrome oxidase assembly protein [Planctomycetales bacterium]
MADNMAAKTTESRRHIRIRNTIVTFMMLLIIPFSLWGFGSKFLEFVHVFRGESDGSFAVAPIVNYILASCGFFLMFVWAIMNGMFHDIEGPKYSMLEIEDQLDHPVQSKYAIGGRITALKGRQ